MKRQDKYNQNRIASEKYESSKNPNESKINICDILISYIENIIIEKKNKTEKDNITKSNEEIDRENLKKIESEGGSFKKREKIDESFHMKKKNKNKQKKKEKNDLNKINN